MNHALYMGSGSGSDAPADILSGASQPTVQGLPELYAALAAVTAAQ